jgi:hypothetical protein
MAESKTGEPARRKVRLNTRQNALIVCISLWVFAALFFVETLRAQGTAFTYQGQLNYGSPASGTYKLTFSLFATNVGGAAIAGPVTNGPVVVSNGLFTVTMDFGASVWNGQTNWLQMGVETNGAATFTPLTPRQQLTPTPYAITAGNVTGVVPSGGVAGTYGSAVTFSNPANQFSGNGAGLTSLNASQLSSGTVPNAMLPTNVAFLNGNQIFSGVNNFANLGNSFNGNFSGNIISNAATVTPLAFGGSGNGISNDSAAFTAMYQFANSNAFGVKVDLMGRVWALTNSPPEITARYFEMSGGVIEEAGANNCPLHFATMGTPGWQVGYQIHNLEINFTANATNTAANIGTNCVGIFAGDPANGNYWHGCEIDQVMVLGAYRAFEVAGCISYVLAASQAWGCVSNAVYVTGSVHPDGINIEDSCDFDQANYAYAPANAQNCILIQSDVGCNSFTVDGVNGGTCKQGLVCTPGSDGLGSRLKMDNDNFGNGYDPNINDCFMVLSNSSVTASGVAIFVADALGATWSPSSIYYAGWQIDYTGGGYYSYDTFLNPGAFEAVAGCDFDVCEGAVGADNHVWPVFTPNGHVRYHNGFSDVNGTVYNLSFGSDGGAVQNGTNQITYAYNQWTLGGPSGTGAIYNNNGNTLELAANSVTVDHALVPTGGLTLANTNTLALSGGSALTNTTDDTYLITISAGTGMSLLNGNTGDVILTPAIGGAYPFKPNWILSGTAVTAQGVILSK